MFVYQNNSIGKRGAATGLRKLVNSMTTLLVTALACVTTTVATAYETTVFHAEAVTTAMSATTRSNAPIIVSLDAFNRRFDLELAVNSDLVKNLDPATLAGVTVYKGRIVGSDNSWVRMTSNGDQLTGIIHDGTEMFLMDSISSLQDAVSPTLMEELSNSGASVAMFRAEDVITTATCGAGGAHSTILGDGETLGDVVRRFDNIGNNLAAAPDQSIAVKVVFDEALKQFAEARGSTPQAQTLAHMNLVDGIFSNQVNVKILLTSTVQLPGNDTGGIDAGDLLGIFRQYTATNGNDDISHLFTGREMDSNVAGIAYVSAICRDDVGIGLSEVGKDSRVPTVGGLIAAHEIGHNFGAPHDNQSNSPCQSTPGNFLMNPSINGSDQFSACSLTEMANTIARIGSCLDPYDDGGNNQAPTLDPITDQTNDIGDDINVSVSASDPDGDDLSFSATGLPDGVDISEAGSITGKASTAGTFQSVVSVSDGSLSDSQSVTWTVNAPDNGAPTISNIDDQTNTVGDTVSLTAEATDPDGDDLIFSASGLPAGLEIDAGSGVISGDVSAAAVASVTVTVSDGNADDSTSFTWTVETDDEPGDITVDLPTDPIQVTEDNTTVETAILLSEVSDEAISVVVFSRADSATPGSDYYGFSQTVDFEPGQQSKIVQVQIVDDTEEETTESFQLVLAGLEGNATIGNATTQVNIEDDDSGDGGPAYFNLSPVTVDEDAGSATVTITLSRPLPGVSGVVVATSPNSALNGEDYYGVYAETALDAGETVIQFSVPIIDDSITEADEIINLRIWGPSGGARLGTSTSTITITDDDGA